jgi:hypothetical protein
LKNFDGGKSDYDVVSVDWGNEADLSQPCKNRYDFIGSGITVYAPCKGSEYGVIKPVTTFEGKQLQLLIAHEISTQASGDIFEIDYLMKQMSIANLPDGQVFFEDSPSRISHSVWGQPAPLVRRQSSLFCRYVRQYTATVAYRSTGKNQRKR